MLIPPKKLDGKLVPWKGEELTEEDLKERLEPFVSKEESSQEERNLEL